MAKDDFTVEIEDGRIMFMTSYRNEFGEECKVANIISKERLIEIHDIVNRALAEISNENGALPIPGVSLSVCQHNWLYIADFQKGKVYQCSKCGKGDWQTGS